MDKTKKRLIAYLLTTGQECDLNDLAPLTTESETTNNRPVLYKMRQKFIKQGELAATQKISRYLDQSITAEEMQKIISACWRKNDVATALETIALLLNLSPFAGKTTIDKALQKCLYGAQNGDYYYRPRYQEAIPKIMEMATS